MIQDREKEYEDGLFFGGLAMDQKKRKAKIQANLKKNKGEPNPLEDFKEQDYEFDEYELSKDPKSVLTNFGGLTVNPKDKTKPDPLGLGLKQYLVQIDKINFGQNNFDQNMLPETKKRPLPGGSDEEEDADGAPIVKKKGDQDFLDIGSVSWSMLIAIYFLTLHDQDGDSCLSFDSIHEILDVLKQEFGEMLPFVTGLDHLIREGPVELMKFREHGFIELVDQTVRDPFSWRILMTQKGLKRAKGLCKQVGLLINLEIDLNDKSRNKITINMYDRHLMPIVEELYFTDQTN